MKALTESMKTVSAKIAFSICYEVCRQIETHEITPLERTKVDKGVQTYYLFSIRDRLRGYFNSEGL